MSDATLKILFEDTGDQIPPVDPQPAPPPPRKPSDTVNGGSSDTKDGIESPYERTGPPKQERAPSPNDKDARKGVDEFFGVLKESAEKVADVAGVGRVYSIIGDMLGGINNVIQAFRVKADKSAEQATPLLREAAERIESDVEAARAASLPSPPTPQPEAPRQFEPTPQPTNPNKFDEDTFIAEQRTEGFDLTKVAQSSGTPVDKVPSLAKSPDIQVDTPRKKDENDYSFIQPLRKQEGISDEMVAMEKAATTVAPEAAAAASAPETAAVAGFAAALGPAAIALGGLTAAVVAGAVALKLAFDAINAQVQNLQEYSADVAVAASQSEIRQEFATMRRAERLGPDVASFENARGKIDEKMADLQTEILRILLVFYKVVEPLMPVIEGGITLTASQLTLIAGTGEAILKYMRADLIGSVNALALAQVRAAQIIREGLFDKDDEDGPEDPWMAQWMALNVGMPQHPTAGQRGRRGAAVPPAGRGGAGNNGRGVGRGGI